MRKYFDRWTFLGAAAVFLVWLAAVPSSTLAGIIQAIIPAAVPTANKQGNASKFQLATGSTTNGHCIEYDGSGNAVDAGVGCSGSGAGTPGSTLFSSTTSVGPNNTAVETSLIGAVTGSTTIAANTFTPGALLHVGAQGFFSLPAVADSLTLNVKCGSTVLGSASFTPAAGAITNGTFRVWLDIAARGTGAGGSFITNGLAELSGSLLAATDAKILNASDVAYNFTTTCVMDVTAQWGAAQVGELITGTNVAAWIPGAPVTSVGGLTGAVPGQGNGSKVQMAGTVAGTAVLLCTDANGNTTTSGCPTGITALTAPIQGDWTAFNTTGMLQAPTFATSRWQFSTNLLASGDNLQGVAVALPTVPYTKTFRVWPLIGNRGFSQGGVAYADGTVGTPGKIASCGVGSQSITGTTQTPYPSSFVANNWTNRTTFNGAITLATGMVNTSMMAAAGLPVWFRLSDDNTNWTCEISWDGANYITVFTETRNTFLTATQLVVFANSGGSNQNSRIIFDSYK